MKLAIILSAVLAVATMGVDVRAMPENYAIQAILNDGHLLPHGEMCTMGEWNSIVKVANDAVTDDRRRLRTTPTATAGLCDRSCKRGRYCMYAGTGCKPRRLSATNSATTESVSLEPIESVYLDKVGPGAAPVPTTNIVGEVVGSQCSDAISKINAALDAVEPSLSPDCQAILNSSRNFTCYNAVKEHVKAPTCEIKGFALWNAATDTLAVPDFTNGSSFCHTAFPISIQALTDDCVKRVQFELIGSNGSRKDQSEFAAPFFSSGNKGPSIFETKVKSGDYMLTVYPNQDASLTKTLTFTVNEC